MNRIKRTAKRWLDFTRSDVWRIQPEAVSPTRFALIRLLRIVLLVVRGLREHQSQLRASALTFYTLLSIVPLLALAFGIAKGFGFEKVLERQLYLNLPGQEEVLDRVTQLARTLLEQTRGGAIAGIGLVILLWTVIKGLNHIENAMNEIWEVKEARPFQRKLSDYLAIMFVSPILIIVSSSLTVYLTTQMANIARETALAELLSPVIFTLVKLLPLCLIWAVFTLTYIIMPNTGVNVVSALVGGIVAGASYHLAQWGYIRFQIGVASYNAIYGSFAALPLFLAWVQASWLIMMLGAQISAAHQHVDAYGLAPAGPGISFSLKKLISLRIVHLLSRHFVEGRPPMTAEEIADRLGLPLRLIQPLAEEFVDARVLSRTHDGKNAAPAYQPARDIRDFTIKFIVDTLEHHGTDDLPVETSEETEALAGALNRFEDAVADLPDNRRLVEI